MKFKIDFEFETEFDVNDKFDLTEEQKKELEMEFNTKLQRYGLFDFIDGD